MRNHDNKLSQLLLDGVAGALPMGGFGVTLGNSGTGTAANNEIIGTSNGVIINAVSGKVVAIDIAGSHIFQVSGSALTIAEAVDVAVGTTTGTKIGNGATQKLGFWNATPVVQPATTGTATGFTAGAGTAVKDDSTFTGGTGSKAYCISDIVLALKQAGIMAAS